MPFNIRFIYLSSILLVIIITATITLLNPRMSATIAVLPGAVNNEGRPNKELQTTIDAMASYGIELQFKAEKDKSTAKPILDFFVNDRSLDWAIVPNTGITLPSNIADNFSSLGVIQYAPLGFFVHSGDDRIHRIGDIKGKKIVIWSSPEGKEKPAFSSSDAKASQYSNDYLLEQIFQSVGVTPENTKIINAWPNPIISVPDWDIIITRVPKASEENIKYKGFGAMWSAGDISLTQLSDIDAVTKKIPALKGITYPASGFNLEKGVPKTDTRLLSFTTSAVIRNDLDKGIVLALAEYIKATYGASGDLTERGELPNFSSQETFRPSKVAQDFYEKGIPFTRSIFSPQIYAVLAKLIVIILPLLTIIFPILHFIPQLYNAYATKKIKFYYKEIATIEGSHLLATENEKTPLLDRIERIDEELRTLKLPIMHDNFIPEIFNVRSHLDLVRQRLKK